MNFEAFADMNNHPLSSNISEMSPSSDENGYIDISDRTTATCELASSETSSDINILIPIYESDLLEPNLFSTSINIEDSIISVQNKNIPNEDIYVCSLSKEEKSLENDKKLEGSSDHNCLKSFTIENVINVNTTATGITDTRENSTSSEDNNCEDGVLDLSMSMKQTKDSDKAFKKIFKVPTFNKKKVKSKSEEETIKGATRDDMLEALEKKENEKRLKIQQILTKKKEKERKMMLKKRADCKQRF